MNKKTIIIGVIVSVAVIGGIYLYNRSKKSSEEKTSEPKKEMATEKDAIEVADILGKKDSPMNTNQMKYFIQLYTQNIDKDLHSKIVPIVTKNESSWTTQDKLDFDKFKELVLVKLK